MKIFKKIMVVLFAAAFSLSSFAACAEQGQTGGGGGDPTKTQLKIGVYNGGPGRVRLPKNLKKNMRTYILRKEKPASKCKSVPVKKPVMNLTR